MPDRVLKQVGCEPDEQPPIAQDRRRDEPDVDVEVLGGGIGPLRAQRIARQHGQIDRLTTAQPLLSLGQRKQRVDQLLLLLVLLERLAARLPERVGIGPGVGENHLEQRARRRQRRAQLVRGVGHEPPLRVVGSLERAQHPPRHQPAQPARDQRHDGQRDRRLDLQVVQVGDSLPVADIPDRGLASGRLQGPLDVRRQFRERARRRTDRLIDVRLPDLGRPGGNGLALDEERLDTGIRGGVRHERVGDRQQHRAAGQEQPAVEQGEPPTNGGLGMTQPIQSHRPSPIR